MATRLTSDALQRNAKQHERESGHSNAPPPKHTTTQQATAAPSSSKPHRPPSPTRSAASTTRSKRTLTNTNVSPKKSRFDEAPVEEAQSYLDRMHLSWDSAVREIARREAHAARSRERMDDLASQASTVSAYSVANSVRTAKSTATNRTAGGRLGMLPPQPHHTEVQRQQFAGLGVVGGSARSHSAADAFSSGGPPASNNASSAGGGGRLMAGSAGGLSGARHKSGSGGSSSVPPAPQRSSATAGPSSDLAQLSVGPSSSAFSSSSATAGGAKCAEPKPQGGGAAKQQFTFSQPNAAPGGFVPKMAPKRR